MPIPKPFKYVPTSPKVNKTIRFPSDMISKIDSIVGEGETFSSFVLQACEYALGTMDPQEEEPEDSSSPRGHGASKASR